MARILQVSDSHLSPSVPYSDSNWDAVLDVVCTSQPDLVVHTGDISYNGANELADLEHARRQLDRLPVPWVAIPGNHDIGDFGDTPEPIDGERLARYTSVFGAGSWSRSLDGWQLIGVDVQVLLSELPEAEELWSWLSGELAGPGPAVLFIHRPLMPWTTTEPDDPRRFVTEPARSRLLSMLSGSGVRLVASGHVHQWRFGLPGQPAHVWAPPTWAVLPDWIQPTMGAKIAGLVEHRLNGDTIASELVVPPAVAQVVSGEDFPSPYTH